jgi:hypothetical protein
MGKTASAAFVSAVFAATFLGASCGKEPPPASGHGHSVLAIISSNAERDEASSLFSVWPTNRAVLASPADDAPAAAESRDEAAKKISNSGMNIVLSIISANAEREAMSLPGVWPANVAESTNERSGSGAVKHGDMIASEGSEKYFSGFLLEYNAVGISLSSFSGGGISAAPTKEELEKGGHNIWSMVVNFPDNAPDEMPFLFTKNLEITTEDLKKFSGEERAEGDDLAKKINPNAIPALGDSVVIVQKCGAAQVFNAKDFKNKHFFGSVDFNFKEYADSKVAAPIKTNDK